MKSIHTAALLSLAAAALPLANTHKSQDVPWHSEEQKRAWQQKRKRQKRDQAKRRSRKS